VIWANTEKLLHTELKKSLIIENLISLLRMIDKLTCKLSNY